MKKYRHPRTNGIWFQIIVFLLVMSITIVLVDMKIRPTIKTFAIYQTNIYATQLINDAILQKLSELGADYNDFVNITYSTSGDITSIQTNVVNINKIKSDITAAINKELDSLQGKSINIPIGTLIGGEWLAGRGFNIEFKLVPSSYVKTTLVNDFTDAGINQTLHKILLEVEILIAAMTPGYNVDSEIKTGFLIAETVIVGNVPKTFFNAIN